MRRPTDITNSRLAELVGLANPDAAVEEYQQVVALAEREGWLPLLAALLAEELATVAPTNLPPFPFVPDVSEVRCPSCGGGLIQFVDITERWWDVSHSDAAELVFCGSFETGDVGDDPHITCVGCGDVWDAPDNVTWE